MRSKCNGASSFQQNFEKNSKFTSEVWVFSFFVSSSTFMTAFQLPIFVSAEHNRTILSIYRSEPRFESHTGGKIR